MLDQYQSYIHKSRYARYLPEFKRREHWDETVDRYVDFMFDHVREKFDYRFTKNEIELIRLSILNQWTMPSMRAMMTAGKALQRDNVCGYNCAYVPVDDIKAFDEAMFILMCGTGVGFSVERQYVNKLPEIPDQIFESDTVINVKDSKEGWGKALRMLISLLYAGECPEWDTSKLRRAGAVLKTFGGRCLSGDTIVYKDRKKSRGYNEITIKDLFDMERSQGK
jgi:ribonucleoside-diphosphate reductase alpha chain